MAAKDSNNNKDKALDTAVTAVERQYGKGAIMRMGDKPIEMTIPSISTGSISRIVHFWSGYRRVEIDPSQGTGYGDLLVARLRGEFRVS